MDEEWLPQVSQVIQAAQRCLIVAHIRPDGDAIGSLLGFGLALQTAGKEVQMVLSDGLPSNFRHLLGSDQVRKQPTGQFDFTCTVDCSDLIRTGEALSGAGRPTLNVDHHVTNLNFAEINIVDPKAVATAEILAGLLPACGLEITQPVAAALLTGLITDSIGFRTSNMTPHAMRVAAGLMEKGADLPELYRKALVERSYVATRYWGAGLASLERDNGMVWTSLSLADRKASGYPGRDDADLVNILASIKEARVAVIFIEQALDRVKVSWRSQPEIDVSQIAVQFGGGGHPAASGAEISGSLPEVREVVLNATRALLDRPHSHLL